MGYLPAYVLAAYYNDARLNIWSCLNDVRQKLGKQALDNDDQIVSAIKELGLSKATPEDQARIIRYLHERFGFLGVLMDPAKGKNNQRNKDQATPLPRYYEERLIWLFSLVNELRNAFVHPTDGEYKIPRLVHRRLYFLLSRVYDASFHVVKARFGHSTATMQVFMRCDQKGKPKSYQRFPFALCSDPLNATTHTDLPQSQVLYAFGQVLFCSLFLEKSQSAELAKAFWELAPSKLQAAWSVEQRKIIREILAVYRVRLPLQRLQSTDSLAALTLDSLAELARCPVALFETLSPSDQARFRFEAELGDDTEQEEASSVLFTRSREDRFPSLMMRFLDFDPDNRLRFGVDLGQLHYHVRLKAAEHFTDQQARLRSLGQKILAYGRLQAFEQVEKPATWQLLETNYTQVQTEAEALIQANMTGISTLRPYLIPAYPHYHYFPDRLGFRIATDPQQTASYPELAVSATNEAVRLEPPSASSMQPQFWMSHEQLLHLSFYHYLWKTQGGCIGYTPR